MSYQLGFASFSLGSASAGHCLEQKLEIASRYGYKGVEIDYEDLQSIAARHDVLNPKPRELKAAVYVRELCKRHSLTIICLQSFINIGGLIDRAEHEERMQELHYWINLCHALETDMVQIPSSFLSANQHNPDMSAHIKDFQQIAKIGLTAKPPIRFAFEALCWGPQCQTWEESWTIVKLVDMPNFGLCLDTFHIAGRVWADPAVPSGRIEKGDDALKETLARLVQEVDVSNVFYVQVQDGERLAQPLVLGHPLYDVEQEPRRIWQRNCRLFYGEIDRGAYLPIRDVVDAILRGLEYEGFISFEIFHRRIYDVGEGVIEELASRGAEAWKNLLADRGKG